MPEPRLTEPRIRELARQAGNASAVAGGRTVRTWSVADGDAAIAEYRRLKGLTDKG